MITVCGGQCPSHPHPAVNPMASNERYPYDDCNSIDDDLVEEPEVTAWFVVGLMLAWGWVLAVEAWRGLKRRVRSIVK